MSQVTLTGKFVNAQQLFQSNDFRKQTIIIELVNGNYTSYMPIDFINGDIDTMGPQLAMGSSYSFTCYVQGTKQTFTDKKGQPTAYLNLKCISIAPAQPQAQAPAAQPAAFGQPQQPAPNFGQPAQGGIGQPQAQPFGQQPAQQPTAPAQQFGQPAQTAPAAPFGQPQTPPAFNPNAGQ